MDRQRRQPDLMKMLGQKQLDVTDLAYQFGFFAQNNKWGPIVANGDQVAPGMAIADYRGAQGLSGKEPRRGDPLRHGLPAGRQGVQRRGRGAGQAPGHRGDPGAHHRAEQAGAGQGDRAALELHQRRRHPAGRLDHEDAGFLEQHGFHFVEKKVSREQLFDLSVAKEAKARLEREKPFGN